MLSLALALIGLARAVLKVLANATSADAVKARLLLQATEKLDEKVNAALAARDVALRDLDANGVSDDTSFRD